MSLPGFFSASHAWAFLMLGPLILFYFLKLKRPRLDIPSLVLWRQVLQDSRVNSPFQRFKRNILLFLQILLLCLVALAAMQPFFRGRAHRAKRLPILIDCSASMAALNKAGGRSRLEEARAHVAARIDDMLPDEEYCLIAFSRTARKLTGFTNNRRVLRDALASIRIEDVQSDIEDALRVTQALARGVSFDRVWMLSDGNFPPRASFELSFALDYRRLSPAGPNIGVTSLNARRAGSGGWEVFARIEASAEECAAAVTFEAGGRAESQRVLAAPGAAERLVFRVPGEEPTAVRVRVEPAGFDALAADNEATLDLPRARPIRVYAAMSLAAFRHALSAIPGVAVHPGAGPGLGDGQAYDLVITDREADFALPARMLFSVGCVPDDLRSLVSIDAGQARVVDWERRAPLLQHVEMRNVLILTRSRLAEGAGEADFENLDYEVRAWAEQGPLLVERRRGGQLSCHLLFHPDRSTLPYRVGFPILVTNVVRTAMRESGLAEARAHRTGVLPRLRLKPDATCRVVGPGGLRREEKAGPEGVLNGIPAPRAGMYRVMGGAETRRVFVSLLSSLETSLTAIQEIEFNEGLTVAASTVTLRSDKPLWPALAFAAFCLLLIEWWYFQRRRGGYAR